MELLEALHCVDSVHHVHPTELGVDHAVYDFGRRPRFDKGAQDFDDEALVLLQLDDRLEVVGNTRFVGDGVDKAFVIDTAALFGFLRQTKNISLDCCFFKVSFLTCSSNA